MHMCVYVRKAGGDCLKKKFSSKALKRMEQAARREEWIDLVRLERIAEFVAWLTDDFHEWQAQSPDVGEAMRACKHGRIISVRYDGRRTICGRCVMALWHTYQCFKD